MQNPCTTCQVHNLQCSPETCQPAVAYRRAQEGYVECAVCAKRGASVQAIWRVSQGYASAVCCAHHFLDCLSRTAANTVEAI